AYISSEKFFFFFKYAVAYSNAVLMTGTTPSIFPRFFILKKNRIFI
ncbi:hypothetical protein AAJ76_2030003, partial [Vairimorpha ceranae]